MRGARRSWIVLFCLALPALSVHAGQGPFVTEWLVLGTFPHDDSETILSTEYIPNEREIAPSAGERTGGREWRVERTADAGNLNFNQMGFDVTEECAVYAHVYVHSDEERNVRLLLGSDDGVMLCVNGRRVHYNLVFRGWGPDEDTVVVRLGRGWNRLLFKVFNGSGGFDLSARFTELDGSPAAGVAFSVENPYGKAKFVTPSVSPWVVFEKVEPGTAFKTVEGRFELPVRVSLKNIGTRDAKGIAARLVAADKETGKAIFRKDFGVRIPERGPADIDLTGKEILAFLDGGHRLEAEVRWEGRVEKGAVDLSAEKILDALIATKSETIPDGVAKKLAYLDSNLCWARFFRGDAFRVDNGFTFRLARDFFRRDWKSAGAGLDELIQKVRDVSPSIKKDAISFAGNAHIDMAWLWKYEETIEVCHDTFQSALDFADKYPRFVYVQSQAQAYWWMEHRFPALFERIREKVRTGQWEIVGGMWIEPDMNIPSGESLVRQLLLGKRYFQEKFGMDVRVGYVPDSFGYNWMTPQILKKAGIDYFITQKLGWNKTNKFPYRLFWWESPDGSRVLTFFPHTYVHDAAIEKTASQFKEFKETSGAGEQLVLYGVGDHGGGPTQLHIDRIHAMQKLDAFPAVRESKVVDFLNRAAASPAADSYPTWRDELYLETHRGTLTTQAAAKKNNRRSEILLEEAEKYAILSGIPYPSDDLHEAWRLTLFNQFHDILPGSSIADVYKDSAPQYAFVKSLAGRVIDRSLSKVADSLRNQSEGIPVVVFNPLSWERTDLVTVEAPDGFEDPEHTGLFTAAGREVPYEYRDGGEIVFTAEAVPSVGYTTLYLRKGRKVPLQSGLRAGADFIENEFLRVTVDPETGNIASLFDKANGWEVLEAGRQGNVLELFEDIPSEFDAWNIGYTGKEWAVEDVKKISVGTAGPTSVSLRVERVFGDSTFTQDLTLYRGCPRLDIENSVDWHESHKLLKAAFNLAVRNDFATYEIPYGTIERAAVPKNSFDEAKFEVSGHKWIDLSDRSGDHGVSMLNDCKYGFDVRGGKMRITLLRSPKYPDPEADRGKHRFVYSIYPHKGDWREAQTFRHAYELNYPLGAVAGRRGTGALPETLSLVSSSSPDIMVSAVKKAEDSDGVVVRFYELHGRPADTELAFSRKILEARETDLMEKPLADLAVQEGDKIRIAVKPHEIKTLVVTFEGETE